MNKTSRILYFTVFLLLLTLSGTAAAYQLCVCLDPYGVKYPDTAQGSSLCYICDENSCVPNGFTLAQCRVQSGESQQPVYQEPVYQEPAASDPKPVVNDPAPTEAAPQIPVIIDISTETIPQTPVLVEVPSDYENQVPDQSSQPVESVVSYAGYQEEPVQQPVYSETVPNETYYPGQGTETIMTPISITNDPVESVEEDPILPQVMQILDSYLNGDEPDQTTVPVYTDTEPQVPDYSGLFPGDLPEGPLVEPPDDPVDEPDTVVTDEPTEEPEIPVSGEPEEEPTQEAAEPAPGGSEEPEEKPTEEPGSEPESILTSETTESPEPENVLTQETPEPVPTEETVSEEKTDIPETEGTEEPDALPGNDPEGETGGLDLSAEALNELSDLLSEEELSDLAALVTVEWLEKHADELTEETLAELYGLILSKGPEMELLSAPAVSIEGDLKAIQLATPSETVWTEANVPFEWNYIYDEGSGAAEVTFVLSMTIHSGADTTMLSETVSSVSCANGRCTYVKDMSSYKNATVTWTVSGTFKDGSVTKTVNAEGSRTFTLKIKDKPTPTPTPTATPVPTDKPEAPVLECPVGRYTTRDLGFYWAPSKYAETYTVHWRNDKNQHGSFDLSDTDSTCLAKRCNKQANMPGTGKYVWYVTAKNSAGSTNSKEMSFEIATNITTPTAYRPNGTISNVGRNAAFEWEDVRDGVYEYRVQVVGKYDGKVHMDRWFLTDHIYVGKGICYVQTDVFLPAGYYSWRVQGRNKDFTSNWSGWRDFYVSGSGGGSPVPSNNTANTVPTCIYPTGVITTDTPNYQWRTLTGAAYYIVQVFDASGTVLINNQVPSSSNCNLQTCTWAPNVKLPRNGSYTWTVYGYGGNNALWNTAKAAFTLNATAPVTPVPVQNTLSFITPAQNGYLSAQSPVISWTDPGAGTSFFHIEIFGSTGTLMFNTNLTREQTWCNGKSCSIEFKTIPDGQNYKITVTPYSAANTPGTAISLIFNKGSRPLRLISPKENSTVSSRPMFRWEMADTVNSRYELVLTDARGTITTYSPLICNAEGVNCEEGEVFFSPANPLASGAYTARLSIQGSSAVTELHFTIK